jgi:hypothetical protein
MKKGGFIVGGQYGFARPSVAREMVDRPLTIKLQGGSFGLQIGAGETDVVLIMNEKGVDKLLKATSPSAVRAGDGGSAGSAGPGLKQAIKTSKFCPTPLRVPQASRASSRRRITTKTRALRQGSQA